MTDPPSKQGPLDDPDIRYHCCCVICGEVIENGRYGCTCGEGDWPDEYRTADVKYEWTDREIKKALDAFRRYSMDDARGMMQYTVMPHRKFAKRLRLRLGTTPMFALRRLSRKYGLRLVVKDEGQNPGGSFKDRESAVAALHSLAKGRKRAVIYSSGNAAASAAMLASHLNIELITCVSGDTYSEKVDYIRSMGSDVIRIGDDKTNYEAGYRLFSRLASEGFFARRNMDNWSVRNPFRVTGDKTTALEVVKQYGAMRGKKAAVPDYVIVPTGNGSCLAGMWKGFVELHKIGAIEHLPKMVSAAIKNASPIFQAFHNDNGMKPEVCDLDEVSDSDMEIGSVIVAEESYDGIMATDALHLSDGEAIVVTREEIQKVLIELLEEEWPAARDNDFLPEPAALVALAAVSKIKTEVTQAENPSVVAVMTGHGSKAKTVLNELLDARPDLKERVEELTEDVPSVESDEKDDADLGKLIDVKATQGELRKALDEISTQVTTAP